MKQREYDTVINEAAKNLYWMYGLESYLEHISHPELNKYIKIKRAIMYGNPWDIRDLVHNEIRRGDVKLTREFLNLLFNQHTAYKEITHRKVLQYIAHNIDDEYIRKIASWSIRWQERALLNDHFSRGQMQSKLWMVDELKRVFPNKKIGTIAHYGGWYATVAQHLFQHFDIQRYWNLEKDIRCIQISDDFNYEQKNNQWQYKAIGIDVDDIYWRTRQGGSDVDAGNEYFRCKATNAEGKLIEVDVWPDLIINTSCEHMSESWFERIPPGKMICLQTNDYFSNEQHINCVHSVDDAVVKYPMSQLIYKGEIETATYNRFMIIGVK